MGFVPTQDKGYLIAFAQLPDASTLDRTEAVIRRMSAIGLKHKGVTQAIAFPGLSINGFVNSPNSGIIFFGLDDFEKRKGVEGYGPQIAAELGAEFGGIQDAYIAIFPPPPVQGLGTIGGFKMELEDRGALGEDEMNKAIGALLTKAYATPELAGVFTGYQTNVPQLSVDVDREKVKRQGLNLTDVFGTLQTYLGSAYVNDFTRFGRTYRVVAQADAPYRASAENIGQFEVPNARHEMVPLSSVLTVRTSNGPDRVVRYNAYPTAEINGGPAAGVSSGQAVTAMERIANETLPNGMKFEWTELTYQQILSGNTALLVFPLCVLLAFLVLAAQYESWSLPLAVILIVPMGLLSAIGGVWLTKGDNNIFTQIGLIVLVGLACKNAILIVEFARELERDGRDRVSAALEACRLRLRPILMTSLAFIMGVVPLVLSHGAGAEMRHAMGVAVFSGMIGVTVFGLILTPVFFVIIRGLASKRTIAKVLVPAAIGLAAATSVEAQSPMRLSLDPTSTSIARITSTGAPSLPTRLPGVVQSGSVANSSPRGTALVTFVPFWQQLGDSTLERLTSDALRANGDVRSAQANVREARAARKLVAYDFAPTVVANGGLTHRRLSALQLPGVPSANREGDIYDAGFDASWELDIFHRTRSAYDARGAIANSASEDLKYTQLTLVSDLARSYYELRGAQRQLNVANRNVVNQKRTLQLTVDRLAAGRGTAFDRERASTQVSTTLAEVVATEARIAAANYRINALVGSSQRIAPLPVNESNDLDIEVDDSLPFPAVPSLESVMALVKRRPDVQSAEQRAVAQNSLIGVARSEYLPRVSVVGSVGYNSGTTDLFGRRESSRFAIGPTISWAAFDLGRVHTRVEEAHAQADGARSQYDQILINAQAEVESAIVSYDRARARVSLLHDAASSSERGAQLAKLRFDGGESDFLEVLDAERSMFAAQAQLAEGETAAATAYIALYKALGGTWSGAGGLR